MAKELNHEDLKDLEETFAGCTEGKSAFPFGVFEVFVVRFAFSVHSRPAARTV